MRPSGCAAASGSGGTDRAGLEGSSVDASVVVGDRLVAAAAPAIRAAVQQAVAADATVRLDLSAVVVYDLAGLGLLVRLHRLARENGAALVLVDPPTGLRHALVSRGLHRILAIEPGGRDRSSGG